MIETNNLIPLIAIIFSVGGFLVSAFSFRQKAETNYVNALESRIDDLTKRMEACEKAREDLAKDNLKLHEENVGLLRKIVEEGVIKNLSNQWVKKEETKIK